MASDSERARLFTRRAILIGGLQTGLFALLASRVYYLDVIEGEKYRTLAEENRVNLRLLAPPRGQIFDRSGAPLALNQQNFRVVLLPEQVGDVDQMLSQLGKYIDITENDRKRILRDMRSSDTLSAIVIKDNLTRDQMDVIAVHSVEIPGIDIDVGEVRTYPYSVGTSHILGYVGTASANDMKNAEDEDESNVLAIPGFRIGKNGIEDQYDEPLRGQAGDVQMEVNAHGSVVRELARNNPVTGQDLTLSIDIGLQQFVQNRLAQEQGAACVVMEVETGAIRAMVSQPGFDPNLFTYGISLDDWNRLNTDDHAPLMNKAITGVYAPGSVIKPVVAMAGLESGEVDPSAKVYCPGFYQLGDYKFYCWKHGGHGHVDMQEAIAGSCDTYFYDLGRRVGIDRLQAMMRRFGMGEKLGVDLPHERAGFIPSRTWKMATHHQAWQQGETLIASIGQGYILTSPLQLAVMAARIANGGKIVVPHMGQAKGGSPLEWPPALSMGLLGRNINYVREAMASVVNKPGGTAYSSRIREEGFEMAGKTGTAQVRRISESERTEGVTSNEDLPWKERDHALFAGFAPVNKPRFAISVILEHGGSGGHMAAPMAHDILLECQKRFAT